jgi:hypothetical protein
MNFMAAARQAAVAVFSRFAETLILLDTFFYDSAKSLLWLR